MSAAVRIIGIGSPGGDDRIGWLAAQALEGTFDAGWVEVSWHDRPGAQLVRLMEGAEVAVLLDGVKSGAAPGMLHRLEGEDVAGAVRQYTSTHGFGLAEALQLAAKLGSLPPRVVLLGVEIGNSSEDALTPAVEQALPVLVAAAKAEVARAMGGSCTPCFVRA